MAGLILFLEPLGRGINVHTPLNYEILDCEDFMCIKYIASVDRNQDEQCYFLHRKIRTLRTYILAHSKSK